jgi:hypothetical protein
MAVEYPGQTRRLRSPPFFFAGAFFEARCRVTMGLPKQGNKMTKSTTYFLTYEQLCRVLKTNLTTVRGICAENALLRYRCQAAGKYRIEISEDQISELHGDISVLSDNERKRAHAFVPVTDATFTPPLRNVVGRKWTLRIHKREKDIVERVLDAIFSALNDEYDDILETEDRVAA